MTLLKEEAGCKVGWANYDNEAEATERGKLESERRERKFAQGYDFGYQWPGSVDRKVCTGGDRCVCGRADTHDELELNYWRVVCA